MPFQRRNLRGPLHKRIQGKLLKDFPQEAHKRFEQIAAKMKEISSPFSVSLMKFAEKQDSKKSEKSVSSVSSKSATPVVDFVEAFKKKTISDSSGSKKKEKTENSPESKETSDEFSGFYEYPRHTMRTFFIALLLLIVFWGGVFSQVKSMVSDFTKNGGLNATVQTVAETFGTDLKMDSLHRTNILLLGSGGKNHDGGFLTDSIIVASFNHETKSLSMLSIPRDLYVSYRIAGQKRKAKINALFRDGENYWKYRKKDQSEIFANASVVIKDKAEEIIGSEIHYTAYIDFEGFTDIVDELGGLTVNVESRIHDTAYPGPNYSYQTFTLEPGLQTLDGKTALKYVRTRHGISGGDFGRSHRQKQAILALKDQALASGLLTNPEKFSRLLDIIENHFWTDMSFSEMISTVSLFQNLQKKNIVSVGITDTVEQGIGGFLYTPPRDDIARRMSVFLPYLTREKNPYAQINFYWETISTQPKLVSGEKKIEIFNTTKQPGLASKTAQNLLRYAIPTAKIGNTDTLKPETYIEYIDTEENQKMAKFLARKLNVEFLARKKGEISAPEIDTSTEDESLISPLDENTFRLYIGKDFNRNAYSGTLIRTPLPRNPEISQ